MDIAVLEELGLTKSEIRVYLALLGLGSSSTGPIVEKSGSASSKIYEILEKLMQKGLASFVIKSGVKYFEPASPERIMDYLQEKENQFTRQRQELKRILPELNLRRKMADSSETTVFKGMKGAITAFQDMLSLKKGEEITITGHTDLEEWFKEFLIRFHKKRSKLGIKARLLYGPKLQGLAQNFERIGRTKIKQYPQGYENPAGIFTYKDTTLFSLPYDKLWIQIKNKRLAQAHHHQFEALWNQEVSVMRGKEAVLTMLKGCLDAKECYCIGAQAGLSRYSMDLFKWFLKESENKQIPWKFLCDPEFKRYEYRFKTRNPGMVHLKYLTNQVGSPTVIWFYGNTTATVVWKTEPVVTFIESKEITDHYRKYFQYFWDQDTVTLRGFEGIQEMCNKVIETGKDFYIIGANARLMHQYPEQFKRFDKQRVKKSINRHLLAIREIKNSSFVNRPLTKVRFLPAHYTVPMVIWIFGPYVAQTIWTKPEAIFMINNQSVADDYRMYFNSLWRAAGE